MGKTQDPLIDYVIVVNGEAEADLSGLPKNVQIVRRENLCYDGGAAGEVIRNMDIRPYQYFIILNSSVRGPFLPRYFNQPWTSSLLDLLNDRVKLVGTTISCEIRVHVQSMVLATDRVGMEILWKAGTLDCAKHRDDAINKYELGASARIMEKG